jgi:cystathionine beta-lyase/cystathionine gamma-synthase
MLSDDTLHEKIKNNQNAIDDVPSVMTHAYVSPLERERIGISGTFIRVSVGIENDEDLIVDRSQAFDKV